MKQKTVWYVTSIVAVHHTTEHLYEIQGIIPTQELNTEEKNLGVEIPFASLTFHKTLQET